MLMYAWGIMFVVMCFGAVYAIWRVSNAKGTGKREKERQKKKEQKKDAKEARKDPVVIAQKAKIAPPSEPVVPRRVRRQELEDKAAKAAASKVRVPSFGPHVAGCRIADASLVLPVAGVKVRPPPVRHRRHNSLAASVPHARCPLATRVITLQYTCSL